MFLFTTPGAPASAPPTVPDRPSVVVDAIRQGADRSGVDFDYLLRTARRESALDPAAKAPTSSATGLFQFIEQTWLGLVKKDGDRVGLGDEARAVTSRPDGSLTVADPEARRAILKLREDPELASTMAGALTRQNRDALLAATGREPSQGDLYVAHVLGSRGAADLIRAAGQNPNGGAADIFPEAARANRGIFYDRGGRPRGAGEVYGLLSGAQAASSAAPAVMAVATPSPSAKTRTGEVPPAERFQPKGLDGLFQTGSRTGPLSDAVARIWRVGATAQPSAAVARVAFFPRSDAALADESDAVPVAPTLGGASIDAPALALASAAPEPRPIRMDVPLPPVRPSFAPQGRVTVRVGRAAVASSAQPLDLNALGKERRP